MSHEGGPEGTQQRTVAELLAMYGGDTSERAPRRRRRREETGDTAPQAIIERINSESAKLAPIQDDQPPPTRTSHRQQPPAQRPSQQLPIQQPSQQLPIKPQPSQQLPIKQPSQQLPKQQPSQQLPANPRPAPPRSAAAPARPAPTPRPPAQQPSQQLPAPPQQGPPHQQMPQSQPSMPPVSRPVPPPEPPGLPRRDRRPPQPQMPSGSFPAPPQQGSGYFPTPIPPVAPRNGNVPEAATEQMPRVPPANRAGVTGAHPVPVPPAGPEQRNGHFDDDYTEYGLDEVRALKDYQDEFADEDVDADEFVDDEDLDEGPSAGREWLVMAIQVALSVLGGAGVWLGFNWLWGRYPQAALGAAIVVIVGLVWIVRKIRRADDLQTTGLAVLVGLFCTVSPAALLLLSR